MSRVGLLVIDASLTRQGVTPLTRLARRWRSNWAEQATRAEAAHALLGLQDADLAGKPHDL